VRLINSHIIITVLLRTREKETSERQREVKAKETTLQFYKEKVIHNVSLLVFMVFLSVFTGRTTCCVALLVLFLLSSQCFVFFAP